MSTQSPHADRIELTDLFTRFSLLLDEKRWDDAGDVFAEDVTVHSPRGGSLTGLDNVVGFLRKAEVEGESTQHITTDLLLDLHGDRASVAANSLVYFFRDGQAPHMNSGLRLTGDAKRTPVGWRLHEWRIIPLWIREN
ncbi:nuclear transport factor 2 family protein [Nonomuraea candida]|uniref:nuclear transport factor 2 family protein n=1 Tax=Nonomuraea candida TaxID=359159 RepID=UPI0005B8B9B9|nr:nuclear transport factor 2 family protein [Nonomuraea candida]